MKIDKKIGDIRFKKIRKQNPNSKREDYILCSHDATQDFFQKYKRKQWDYGMSERERELHLSIGSINLNHIAQLNSAIDQLEKLKKERDYWIKKREVFEKELKQLQLEKSNNKNKLK